MTWLLNFCKSLVYVTSHFHACLSFEISCWTFVKVLCASVLIFAHAEALKWMFSSFYGTLPSPFNWRGKHWAVTFSCRVLMTLTSCRDCGSSESFNCKSMFYYPIKFLLDQVLVVYGCYSLYGCTQPNTNAFCKTNFSLRKLSDTFLDSGQS